MQELKHQERKMLENVAMVKAAPPSLAVIVSLSPAKLSALERAQKFIDGLAAGKTVIGLAQELNVSPMTLYRDFDEWMKTNGPAHLQVEWLKLYEQLKLTNPEKALECLTRLLCKVMEKEAKIEVNMSSTKNLTIIKMWQPNAANGKTEGSNPAVLPI
jgi:hypothetical protein